MNTNFYTDVEQLLMKKKYEPAVTVMKTYFEEILNRKPILEEKLLKEIKGKKVLINLTDDKKRNRLFCIPLLNYLKTKNLEFLNNYLQQCTYINEEFEKLNSEVNLFLEELKGDNHIIALFKILSTFENKNHEVLNPKNIDPYNIYNQIGWENDSLYESNIEAVNILVDKWRLMAEDNLFNLKRYKEKDVEKLKPLSLNEIILGKIRALKFLSWLIDEVTNCKTTIEVNDSNVLFIYEDFKEYMRSRLPAIRESFLINNINFHQLSNIKKESAIDFDEIMKLKTNGEHFSLEYSSQLSHKNLVNSIEIGKSEYKKLYNLMGIENYAELEFKGVNIEEVFMFYFCLRNIADIYYGATEHFINKYNKLPKAPFLFISLKSLDEQLSKMLSILFKRKITIVDIEKWVKFYTFGEDRIVDLYYKPLIRVENYVAIMPSLFLMNNMYRTFTRHLQLLNVDLSDKGDVFEQKVRGLFANTGFFTYKEKYLFNYSSAQNKEISGDIDLIAYKGSYLFIGEAKNHLDPLSPTEYRAGDKIINKGYEQLNKILKYIEENQEEFAKRFGITLEKLKKLTIIPFIILSGYYRSGEKINGIPIADYGSLVKFIRDGELTIGAGETKIKVPIRESELTALGLINHLENPYFYEIEGCYAPFFYTANTMEMSDSDLYLYPRIEELNMDTYKYAALYPDKERVRLIMEG